MKRDLSVNKQQQEKNNRHLKVSHRQFDYYFRNNHFLPGGTWSSFDDYLWDNINILKLKSLFFRNPPPTLLHPEKWCRGFNHFISQWVFFFTFYKQLIQQDLFVPIRKQNFLMELLLLQVFDYSFLFTDFRPCLSFLNLHSTVWSYVILFECLLILMDLEQVYKIHLISCPLTISIVI